VPYSPDGRQLASSHDKTTRLRDLAAGEEIRVFSPEAGTIFDTAFSPDGRYALVTTPHQSAVLMWDVSTGKLLHAFEAPGRRALPA
jgi:WD40 repeat protein